MATLRLQKPLVLNGNNIYPLTTYNQIIMPDGSRWDGESGSNGASVTLNGAATTNASFYAPTTAGTDGQVLKSNGSGAPGWGTLNYEDVGAAPKSHSHTRLIADYITSVPTTLSDPGEMHYHYSVPSSAEGMFSTYNNANGILTLNTHGGDYYHQLGFSSNGMLYHRSTVTSSLSPSVAWSAILTESNWSNYIDVSGILSTITPSSIGAAPASHNHSASHITSGTLPVARGGTGGTDKSTARTNLGLDRAKVMYEIDLSSYSTSNFYFIDFDVGDFELDCEIHSNNLGGDQPYNQNHIHFLMTYNGWSDTKKTFAVLSQGSYSETELTIMSIYAGTQNGLRGVYVRGGLTYRIFSNVPPTLNTTTKTHGEESYASGTTSYTNVANATQVWVNDGKTKASWSVPLYGAVWNDYAEYRNQIREILPGYITYSEDDGVLRVTSERLQRFEGVVSDTFGFAIGETNECKTPIAVSGRVLVYTNPEDEFHAGDCVCAGPGGLAYRMTRDEVIMYPDRIVGVVSEIPTYETWGTGNVPVNNRIWIKVK